MLYRFIDTNGTFRLKDPQNYGLYFPLTNSTGSLLSSISPNLSGDIKTDNDHFITPPASFIDIKTNLLCRRDFFINNNGKILRLSQPWKDTVEAGLLYHKLIKETQSLKAEITNFIPSHLGVEIMWVRLTNKGKPDLKFKPTSFIPLYGRSEKNLRDHRHVSSLLNRIELTKYGIILKPTMVFDEKGHKANLATYFSFGFEGKTNAPRGQFPTIDCFCGHGDLIHPEAVEADLKPHKHNHPAFSGKEAVAALAFSKKILKSQQSVDYFLITGQINDSGNNSRLKINNLFVQLNTPKKIKRLLAETKKYWLNDLNQTKFNFPDNNFNNWLLWVKLQPTLRKLFGNSFLPHFDYGKGGRGWRDLSQDALALLLTEPKKAKQLIANTFKGVRIDGSNATIITKKGDFLSDRNSLPRVWMDHGIWPYLSLRLYIDQTADLAILNRNTPYFRDRFVKRSKEVDKNFDQKDFILRSASGRIYQGNILEHVLIQHLTAFFNVGKHNIIRLENADWNDGLDMAADKGESVAFSFMYARNLKDIVNLLKKLEFRQKKITLLKEVALLLDRINRPINYSDYKQKQNRLNSFFEKTKNISGQKISLATSKVIADLEAKATHLLNWLKTKEWLKQGFFNGYYDNRGKPVEGKTNKLTRIMLPSQVFPLMSGDLSKKQAQATWKAIKKYLKDPKLDGFRLNSDFKSLYLDLGRAFGFSYGDKENGAFFNHMAIMLSFALYESDLSREGSMVLNSIYKMAISDSAKIYPGIPEYFNACGLGQYLYLTGSASWYIYTLFEKILGVKFIIGDIYFNPYLDLTTVGKGKISLSFFLGNKKITITYRERGNNNGSKIIKLLLNNKTMAPQNGKYLVKKDRLRKTNYIEVYFK